MLYHQSRVDLKANPSHAQDYEDGFPAVDWAYWQSTNSDLIGWITIPGTNIDTAIVQARSENPQYYLNHDIWKAWNPWGAVYLSSECIEEGLESPNAVIYGHNMGALDTRQFGDLEHFVDIGFATQHTDVLLQTPKWKKRLKVDFVELIDGEDQVRRTSFVDEADFASWYKERFRSALFILNDNLKMPKNNYSLITCSYHYGNNERTAINASVH